MIISKALPLFFLLIGFMSCTNQQEKTNNNQQQKVALAYAKRFTIKKDKDLTILEILGNKKDSSVTATFVLYSKEKPNTGINNAYYIKTPVSRVASMSSIYTTMLEELQVANTIVAIDNVDYYTNKKIQEAVSKGHMAELSKGPAIEVEKTLALKPDLLLTFGMGNPKDDIDKKLIDAGLPVAISLDHLEATPLARYEWIKFFACFFNKEAMADSLFRSTEKKYNDLKHLTINVAHKPAVLTEMKYGDTWHVPGGSSFIANLLADAGASYLWADEQKTGSMPLSFEMVYAKAKDCDVWINLYNINSKKELLSYDERYGLFKAFKNNALYNNNKVQNDKGFSNYWEDGITNPDEVLADLIAIFYPDLLPGHTFKYYKKIE